jgi:hypothetical protein
MNQRKDAQTRLWIRNRDSLGQMVDRGLIEAAHLVWERARLVVIRYLAEDTETTQRLRRFLKPPLTRRPAPWGTTIRFNSSKRIF